jgi:hypothetical protein
MESRNDENVTTFTDSIVFDTIKDMAARAEIGLAKYNTTMDREDLISSDWVQHAYEECLDMALYLKRLRKDMLAMEEELRAFKTQAMIKERWDEIKQEKEKKGYTEGELKAGCTLTRKYENSTCTTTNSGTKLVYDFVPKPNETYTDLEDNKIKRAWHH